jgi:hypothetical protein
MTYTQAQFDKLPKWAQKCIDDQTRHILHLKQTIAMERDRPESPFKYNDNGAWDKWHNLPEDHNIRVMVGPDRDAYVDIRLATGRDSCQEPAVYLSANRGLRIQPESHNTLYVIPEAR